jgi:sarcosine oxidase subunit beta
MGSQKSPDAIIIGAGVIGCAIALGLARAGLKTLNLDALPAAGYGSTSHSSAVIRPFYSHVTAAAISHEARFRWLNWAAALDHDDPAGMARYTESGGLVLMREGDEQRFSGNLRVLEEIGVDYEILDASALSRLYPGISLDAFGPPKRAEEPGFGEPVAGRISGGIFMPAAGYVSDPQLAAHNIMSAARALGADFRFNARVVEVRREGGRVLGVTLEDGEALSAPVLVNAAGPHSARINDLAGVSATLRIRTRAERHEVAYLPAPSTYVEGGNGFLVDLDTGIYLRPDGADLLVGSADPACDPPDVVDPDAYSAAFTQQWTAQVYRAAQRFPDLPIENTARGTVGLYDVSNDWIPVYDRTDLEGFYLAIGTSGNQFKNAPMVGELMANVILKGERHDVEPAELELPEVGRTVTLDFYSRHREIQQTSSVLA